jgi:hypothetical protein
MKTVKINDTANGLNHLAILLLVLASFSKKLFSLESG